MERKIGEIFEYNGEYYQVVECSKDNYPCIGCYGCKSVGGSRINGGECNGNAREDNKFVIFKKLEKVGEPYADYCPSGRVIYFQRYKCYQKPIYNGDFICWSDDISISIEIKNKEDMEENNNTKHSNSENIGKNLKPFDLQAAKSGKPVCTRDGRKARIICFDTKGDICPIIALVEKNGIETTYHYDKNGQNAYNKSELDLMMLPEKKEGWVNVSKFSTYASKEEALSHKTYDIIDTIKVSWEEQSTETLYELKVSLSSISERLSSDWIPVTVDGKKIESVVLTDDIRVEIKTKEE